MRYSGMTAEEEKRFDQRVRELKRKRIWFRLLGWLGIPRRADRSDARYDYGPFNVYFDGVLQTIPPHEPILAADEKGSIEVFKRDEKGNVILNAARDEYLLETRYGKVRIELRPLT